MKRAILPALVCAVLTTVSVWSLLHGHASFIMYLPFAWIAFEKTTDKPAEKK